MSSEAEIASQEHVTSSYELIPLYVQELSDVARTIAIILGAVLIPFVIWRQGRLTEKRRATLEMIRSLATDVGLHERTSRFYRYRMLKSGDPPSNNPYRQTGMAAFAHDCLIILNYYDVACIEIIKGTVDEELLYQTSRAAIVRSTIIIDELNKHLGRDVSDSYPHLMEICYRWNLRAMEEKSPISRPLRA